MLIVRTSSLHISPQAAKGDRVVCFVCIDFDVNRSFGQHDPSLHI